MSDDQTVTTTQSGNQASVVIQGNESGVHAPGTQDKQKSGERPSWLPEKFKSPEDLARSYTELEKKLGSGAAKKPEEIQTPPPAVKTPVQASALEIEANKAVQKAGFDMKSLQQEYTAKGELSPESLKKLADAGIGEDQITVYKRGMEAQRQDYEAKITEGIEGGRETLQEAMAWAAENLSQPEIDSFNKAVAMGDPNIGKLAVDGLMARFQKQDGPRLVNGQRITGDMGDVFRSHAQITAAQSDPRYEEDPAFRDEVEKKILRSDFSKFKT
jgi:hypothetical protein